MAERDDVTHKEDPPATVLRQCTAAMLEVLDAMFFEVPLGIPEMRDEAPEPGLTVRASFSGGMGGSLHVACETWTARRLAASFLGREDETTIQAEEVQLVVCELANMVCGNMLSKIEPRGRFQIATPEIVQKDQAGRGWLTFPLETGAIAARVRIEDHSAVAASD